MAATTETDVRLRRFEQRRDNAATPREAELAAACVAEIFRTGAGKITRPAEPHYKNGADQVHLRTRTEMYRDLCDERDTLAPDDPKLAFIDRQLGSLIAQ